VGTNFDNDPFSIDTNTTLGPNTTLVQGNLVGVAHPFAASNGGSVQTGSSQVSVFDENGDQVMRIMAYAGFMGEVRVALGDVNGDGLEDLYVGGARGQEGSLFLQGTDGRWKRSAQVAFEADKISEDTGSVSFDADGDGD
jgi:hypothetical protein